MARIATITKKEDLARSIRKFMTPLRRAAASSAGHGWRCAQPGVSGAHGLFGRLHPLRIYFRSQSRRVYRACLGAELDCKHEWAAHITTAESRHTDGNDSRRLSKKGTEVFLPKRQAIVSFVREMIHTHRVSDQRFRRSTAASAKRGMVELAATIGLLCDAGMHVEYF